ncbi:MAG: septum site-determining protein MinD, partial [Geminicoccaceae bacterium]|nr:septum site-determining protein MinD [Geminicoccaceae bacterium]
AYMALYHADEAIVVTNPEVSSVRDSDRILGILNSKSKRAEHGDEPVKQHLLLTRYDLDRVQRGEMLKLDDVLEILAIPVLGVIPQCGSVLQASNLGMPVVLDDKSKAGEAYKDAVARLLGEDVELRYVTPQKRGLVDWLLRRSA